MKRINFRIIILMVFIICVCLLKKTMFIKGDIFYYQMISVIEGEQYALAKIHLIRFLVISPFYLSTYLSEKWSIVIQGILIYLYIRPILKLQNLRVYTFIMLILLLFSYRTSIVAMSLPYFHLYQKNRKRKYLLISFLFSILSSATVLNFIIIYFLYNYKTIYKKIIYLVFFLIFFLPSFKHKILFFTEGGSGYFETMIHRSFIVEAIIIRNYTRIIISVFVILIFFLQFLMFLKNGKIKLKNIERIFPIIFLFMEGLGVYSYLIEDTILLDKIFKNKNK